MLCVTGACVPTMAIRWLSYSFGQGWCESNLWEISSPARGQPRSYPGIRLFPDMSLLAFRAPRSASGDSARLTLLVTWQAPGLTEVSGTGNGYVELDIAAHGKIDPGMGAMNRGTLVCAHP